MTRTLDLYLIPRKKRYILFAPTDIVEQCEIESGDRIRKSIDWLKNRRNRLVGWVGRMLETAHTHYARLEDRIDPMERVLKAIGASGALTVHYPADLDDGRAKGILREILRKQRMKHLFWLGVDSVITIIVLALTPILMPIPGPNVFFYYPALRLLSHHRARRGAASALGSMPVQFKSLHDFASVEENLRGLDRFLERMV